MIAPIKICAHNYHMHVSRRRVSRVAKPCGARANLPKMRSLRLALAKLFKIAPFKERGQARRKKKKKKKKKIN